MPQEETALMEKQTQFPLSFAQERLWFLHKLEPELSVYSIPMQMRLTGPLDMQALAWSLSELENRQEMLRTRFEEVEGQPVQIIAAGAPRRIPLVDLSNLASGEQRPAVGELVAREEEGLFDLGAGRLMRVTVLKLNEQESWLLKTL